MGCPWQLQCGIYSVKTKAIPKHVDNWNTMWQITSKHQNSEGCSYYGEFSLHWSIADNLMLGKSYATEGSSASYPTPESACIMYLATTYTHINTKLWM